MKNILFYQYVSIVDPKAFQEDHLRLCKELDLKGKVLVAKEGINGCVSGPNNAIETYKKELTSDSRFSDIEFKEADVDKHTFKKMFVRVRKEIVTLKKKVQLKKRAPYVEPKELKKWLDNRDDVVLVDARNEYESDIGKFTGAIAPEIQLFSQWPNAVKKMKNLKDKKIVTYCTGGIRCEKASAVMVEQGFEHVHQLHGGIIRYGQECGNAHWEGKCFVFDTRVAIDIDPSAESEPITHCVRCRILSAEYSNCANLECDKRFIACNECLSVLNGCCSKGCRNTHGTA